MKDLEIIFEDKFSIVVKKPAGIPSQDDKTGDLSLFAYLTQYNEKNSSSPYIGLVHRLDRPVGGLMLFAKTERMNKNFNKQFTNGTVIKKYCAVVCGKAKDNDTLEDYLIKNERLNFSKVVQKNTPNSKLATLTYKCLDHKLTEDFSDLSFLEVELLTGRHHQIRVQLENANLPIWGDTKYNKIFEKNRTHVNIALWSSYMEFFHPVTKKNMVFNCKPEGSTFDLFS